jgi:hypothetical protein
LALFTFVPQLTEVTKMLESEVSFLFFFLKNENKTEWKLLFIQNARTQKQTAKFKTITQALQNIERKLCEVL